MRTGRSIKYRFLGGGDFGGIISRTASRHIWKRSLYIYFKIRTLNFRSSDLFKKIIKDMEQR